MKTLYLCGAGNPEGVRLALVINHAQKLWDRIVILDDDQTKHGQTILDVEIAGPFTMLGEANPASDEVSNMVARTTRGRYSVMQKIEEYGLPFVSLIDPGVDIFGVESGKGVTYYRNALFCANATVGEGSVIFAGAIVGHGCNLGKCCVVAPGAVINARVDLGEGAYIGTNASIMPDLKVGSWATVGANSAVVQDVDAGSTVMGVPAQVLIPGNTELSGQSAEPFQGNGRSSAGVPGEGGPLSDKSNVSTGALRQLRKAQKKFISSYKSKKA